MDRLSMRLLAGLNTRGSLEDSLTFLIKKNTPPISTQNRKINNRFQTFKTKPLIVSLWTLNNFLTNLGKISQK